MCHVSYLKDSIAFDHDFRCFFQCFEILTFWAASEVKGQKISRNEKQKLHPSHAMSQEQYRI